MMGVLETFVADILGLTKLPAHLPTLAFSFFGFLLVHQVTSYYYVPAAYKGSRTRNSWAIHVVSQVHTVIIVPLTLWVLYHETPAQEVDRAFGWDERVGFVYAIACGYFIWDSLDAVVNFTDPGFVVHGLACLAIYTMSYKPFVAYYGSRCLLWETSTFFLNIHWFLDKTGRTGSTMQLVNGIFLLFTFFGVRIIYGGRVSYEFMRTLIQVYREVPVIYTLVYGLGNVVLQGLNWFWFYKMISALRRRFTDVESSGERGKLTSVNEHVETESSEGNGTGTGNGYGTR